MSSIVIKPLALCCILFLSVSCAQEHPVSKDLPKLINLEIPLTEEKVAQLHFVVFDESKYSIEVGDNGKHRSSKATLLKAVEKTNAVVGINASFFDTSKFTPQGLMISHQKQTGKLEINKWPPGVVGAKQSGELFIYNEDKYKPDPTIVHLVQAGPWLVKDSIVFDEPAKRYARRSFIGTDQKGKWIIGICDSGISLIGLAKLMTSAEIQEYITVTDLLNLDGGPSTGFACQTSDNDMFYVKEGWSVRNFILVVPKKQSLQ